MISVFTLVLLSVIVKTETSMIFWNFFVRMEAEENSLKCMVS
jgi:hypothetical protein